MAELNVAINKMLMETLGSEDSHVAEVIKIAESDMIEQEVYDKYYSESISEYRYRRRGSEYGSGGLGDTSIMEHTTSNAGDKVKMSVVNMAQGQQGHKGETNLKPGQLAQLVEGGDGTGGLRYSYGDGSEEYMEKRPFQAKTIEELKNNKMHVQTLRFELRNKGLDVK